MLYSKPPDPPAAVTVITASLTLLHDTTVVTAPEPVICVGWVTFTLPLFVQRFASVTNI